MNKDMKTEVRKITPSIAKEMLKRNQGNRNVSDVTVTFYASQMISGDWMFDGQPIRFNNSGRLLDGQHRLSAIVESGTEQQFLIITGIASEAFKVMDTGRNRNSCDVFKISGIPYSSQVSTSCRIVYLLTNNNQRVEGSKKISHSILLDFYNNHTRILDCVKKSENLYIEFSRVLSWSHIGAFMYLFGEKSLTDSEDFFRKLCTGLDLRIDSPIYILRKKLLSDAISVTKLPRNDKYALIIKAWNSYRKGNQIKFLRWNKETEKFPSII